jgi:hypothetical protein
MFIICHLFTFKYEKLEFIKNPMVLEFLETPENNSYNESGLKKIFHSLSRQSQDIIYKTVDNNIN